MREGVARRLNLPVAKDEGLAGLSGMYRVQHDRSGAARRVLHAHGTTDAARHKTMLLVLHRAGPHGHVGEQVYQVLIVLWIEHLIGSEHARLLHHTQVHVTDRLDALKQVGRAVRVWVVKQALVTRTLRARLVGVDARDKEELVRNLLLKAREADHVIEHRVLAICRARAHNEQEARILSFDHRGDGLVEAALFVRKMGRKGHLLANLLGNG